MLTLKLTLPRDRGCYAVATLIGDDHSEMPRGFAVASASLVLGALHDNVDCNTHKPWGHPPSGTYNCVGRAQATPEQTAEYGPELWVFRGEYGSAALSGMYGRPAFLAYAGAAGADGLMRRTQGGFRLTDEMMAAILSALTKNGQLPDMKRFRIRLEEAKPQPAWQFWKRKIAAPLLSTTEPVQLSAPDDEPSLAAALLKQLTARIPRRRANTPKPHKIRHPASTIPPSRAQPANPPAMAAKAAEAAPVETGATRATAVVILATATAVAR